MVRAAVKAGKSQGAKITSRVIDPAEADKWQKRIDNMEEEVEAVLREEKEEKQLAHVEMQLKKGENLIEHEAEIKGRPRRTWFETEKDKKKAKDAGRTELNGMRDSLKRKHGGKELSNKDRKKLDARADRGEGPMWKKGRAEREGKGAVLEFKKDKVQKKKQGRVGSKGKAPAKAGGKGKGGRK